jgi:hypothetical protein
LRSLTIINVNLFYNIFMSVEVRVGRVVRTG